MPRTESKKKKKVHLIGIAGSGMSALAVLFKEAGWQISGTDATTFPIFAEYLRKNKINFRKKYDKKNIPTDTDLIVVSKNAPLATVGKNPEVERAMSGDAKVVSMPEALAMLARGKEQIVVAGSSGKSTVTTILAWCLHNAEKDSSYFVGALPVDMKKSSHFGKGMEFIIEGDEYCSSDTDKRSKFLHFSPESVLLTSGEHDHVNLFPTEESYKNAYKKLMKKIPKSGTLVYALDGKNNKEISRSAVCKKVSYGLREPADWYAKNIKYGMKSSFDLMRKGKKVAKIETALLGQHNMENIVGAGALLLEQRKISPRSFARAIRKFHGVKNRIELKTKNSVVPVYQGFGSSLEKTRAIFDTLRLHFPGRPLVAVFEPYAFSWRNRNFLWWYKKVFENVDKVIMLPAQGHGRKAPDQLNTREVWREVKKHRPDAHFIKNEKEGLAAARKLIQKNDVVALVSSGPMLGLDESIPKWTKKNF